ncbi:hypothetical protein [Cryobacterium sp. PAMC25264]|uniref:hypothetical protein n=1 Tax=Cryobacterium sp. PAMC25264 TaxID=2861288 RepID=UPI001C637E21|nr:hypothetical protein [Cryobacterium sp. PAMC25264]QYF75054.1 hypothetical protein KY500_08165 [Cryobacterium sp. PAMC25264]
MTASPTLRRHAANGVLLTAILALAALVLHTTPSREAQQASIVVPGVIGEPASGRNIRATVYSAAVAEEVTTGNGWAGATPGLWVVVELTVEAVVDDKAASLGTAVLRVGDVSFSASSRPQDSTVADMRLATGIPVSGPLLFEVPATVVHSTAASTATLELAIDSDPRVDSLLVVPVDLTDLVVQHELELSFPEWGSQ